MTNRKDGNTVWERGFTLVELLIVVIVLGILASMVVPIIHVGQEDARKTAFASCVKVFVEAAQVFFFKTGEHLEDSASGTVPDGWDTYIDTKAWTSLTPIGGVWDAEQDSFGLTSSLGVDFGGGGEDRDDDYMGDIDDVFDDGALGTGAFRKIAATRYYYVLAE